jgi:TP901 family phage tail tape measure protein
MADNFQQVIQLAFEVLGAADAQRVADVLQKAGDAGAAADGKLAPLIDKFEDLATKAQLVDKALDLKSRLEANEAALAGAKKSLADLNAEFDRTDKSSQAITIAFAQAQKSVNQLSSEQLKLQNASASTAAQLKTAGIDATQLGAAHADLKAKSKDAGDELSKAAKKAGDVAEAHKKAADEAKKAGTAFEFVKDHLKEIISIAAAVEVALKGIEFTKEGVANAAALEAQLSRVKAAAQDAKDQFDNIDEALEHTAQQANVTAQTAAQGLTALVNGGKSAKDAMDALLPTLQLAKIANIDVAQAAELVGKNLDAFNIPAKETSHLVDLLAAASHGSASALAAIASNAAQLAPDAKRLGLGLSDVVSVLGLLNDKGYDASTTTRELRTIFQQLKDTSSPLYAQLLSLGDGTQDFGNAIATLTAGTPRANAALNSLSGGARSIVEVLGQAGPEALAKFQQSLEGQSGAATRLAKVIDDNLKGAYTGFSNSVEALGEKLGKPVLEPLKNELQKLAGELNAFAESPAFQKIVAKVGEMTEQGVKFVDKFLHGIDWDSWLDDASGALSDTVDRMKELAETATTIATAVNKTADVVGIAYHGVAGSIDGVVGAAATATDKVIGLGQSLANTVGAGDKFRSSMEGVRNIAQSTAEEALNNLDQHTTKLRKDTDDLVGSTDKAAAGVKQHGDAARDASTNVEHHAAATHEAAKATGELAGHVRELPTLVVRAAQAADTLADRLERAAHAADLLKDANGKVLDPTDSVTEALKQLGAVSQDALSKAAEKAATLFATVDKYSANTAAGLKDRQNAFTGYAEKALAAAAGLDEGTKSRTRADLESKAAALGLTDALKQLEAQSSQTGNALLDEAKRTEEAATRQRIAAEQAAAAHFNASVQSNIASEKLAQSTNVATQSLTHWSDAALQAQLEARGIKADFSHANEAMDQLTGGIGKTRAAFAALSPAAAEAYDTVLKGAFDLGHSDDGAGFDRVARAMTTALQVVNKQVAQSRVDLQNMIDGIESFGTASQQGFGAFGNDASTAAERMRGLSNQIAAGNYQVGLLGKEQLGPLQQALEAAASRAQQLADKAQTAAERLASINNQLLDQLDESSGNKEAVENRRFQQQIADIKAAAQEAGALGEQQARDALANAEKIHQDALNKIREEALAKKNPDGLPPSDKSSGGASSGGVSFAGSSGVPGFVPVRVVHHVIPTSDGPIDAYTNEQHADPLTHIIGAIARAKRNSI